MSSLAIELPVPNNRLLSYLRGLLYNWLWWKSNLNTGFQWIVKFSLVMAGIAEIGHGLLVNLLVMGAWDAGAFLVNFLIWRKPKDELRPCAEKGFWISAAMFVKNQGWTLLLNSAFGLPMSTTKLALIPEGIAMNPLMFWLNDNYIFSEKASEIRVRYEVAQAAVLSRMFFLR